MTIFLHHNGERDAHADRKHMHHHIEYKFCPVCGGDVTSVKVKENEPARLVCSKCSFIFYLDPKLVACVLVESGDRIALLRRGISPQKGKWVVPGGYVDRGEKVSAAAIRETGEECGLKIDIKHLFGVYSYTGQVEVMIFYVAEVLDGDLTEGDETREAKWFGPAEIPWDQLAFQSTADALRDYYHQK